VRNNGIKLKMDIAHISFMRGTAKSISSGNSEDYVTKMDMILPVAFGKIPDGVYAVEYDDDRIDVKITTINDKDQDPVFNYAKDLNIGASGSGLDVIPFEAFTDNRGIYPTILITIVFPRRIATWVDDTHETGIRMDFDYEKLQITGVPDNEEKIRAILVVNRLIKSLKIEDLKSISYDDVTVFLETYFKKTDKTPLLLKVNALTTKDAYKNAVYDYVLPNLNDSEVSQSLYNYQEHYSKKKISIEKELKQAIEEVIDSVLKHHIEYRRWIEPFWDGQRTIKQNNEEIVIPRTPKNETRIQPTLHVILDMALMPLGIQVIRESDEGVGSLDFRFLFTTDEGLPLTVGTEFKVAHHKEIKKGITKQLPAYLRSIRSKSGIFVVMWFKDTKYFKEPKKYEIGGMEQWLGKEALRISTESGIDVTTTILDASIRPSASSL